ncbi:hypothetical protein PENSPDRAFT_653226 [Peniophora sp. CONT]|nr:hypothetical protein PENSPDRAFT_653226 [Peniophora sp. CONT]
MVLEMVRWFELVDVLCAPIVGFGVTIIHVSLPSSPSGFRSPSRQTSPRIRVR